MAKQEQPKPQSEVEKAKELLAREKEKRSKKAWEEVQKALQENRCTINFAYTIQGQNVPLDLILKDNLKIIIQPID